MPHPARLFAFVLAAALAALPDAPGFPGEALEASLARLPGEVDQVNSTGRWHTADAEGFYRVIVLRGGYEHVAQRLYVQWLRAGDSEHPPRVVATAGVAEINDAGPFTFSHSLRPLGTNELSIAVNARHGYTGQHQQFAVLAKTPGTYTVSSRAPRDTR